MSSLDEIEKYFWQTLVAVIIGLPLIIITTTKDKSQILGICAFSDPSDLRGHFP